MAFDLIICCGNLHFFWLDVTLKAWTQRSNTPSPVYSYKLGVTCLNGLVYLIWRQPWAPHPAAPKNTWKLNIFSLSVLLGNWCQNMRGYEVIKKISSKTETLLLKRLVEKSISQKTNIEHFTLNKLWAYHCKYSNLTLFF